MKRLIQLIYCSAANRSFSRNELTSLLAESRRKNIQRNITGILLYSKGSFFQVLEGEAEMINALFADISRDKRHKYVTPIIREPIANRSFSDWTMGYAGISPKEVNAILGTNDFFDAGESFAQLGPGRAKKILAAFKHGRWRAKLSNTATPLSARPASVPAMPMKAASDRISKPLTTWYSFAFQPIINVATREIFSYEALIRGVDREPAGDVLAKVQIDQMHRFDEESRILAIELAASMGLSTHLNLNFLPLSVEASPTAITSIISAVSRCGLRPQQIVVEILEQEIINDVERFNRTINKQRGSGVRFAIDDFGAGYAGLNLLADFQPDFIKLDMHLVRGIDRKGPRQAIVRGIRRTCLDLGIDMIAEGVETYREYQWLAGEGIDLFQGRLFASPAFEKLPIDIRLPEQLEDKWQS
jgi:EAL domain-containing protein (putative c-di-GMP-specific phosphodiesterase class I)